jgi:hypothetical protein
MSLALPGSFHAFTHSEPELRTRKTVLDSWVWLDATEGLGASLSLFIVTKQSGQPRSLAPDLAQVL